MLTASNTSKTAKIIKGDITLIGATCRPCGAKNPKIGPWVKTIPAELPVIIIIIIIILCLWVISSQQASLFMSQSRPSGFMDIMMTFIDFVHADELWKNNVWLTGWWWYVSTLPRGSYCYASIIRCIIISSTRRSAIQIYVCVYLYLYIVVQTPVPQ